MTLNEIRALMEDVAFFGYELRVTKARARWYLQGVYHEPCVATQAYMEQFTRKWLLSPLMTKSEIVQTAFKLCVTSMEHRAREHFLYRGRRVYGPHFDVDRLWDLAADGLEERIVQ